MRSDLLLFFLFLPSALWINFLERASSQNVIPRALPCVADSYRLSPALPQFVGQSPAPRPPFPPLGQPLPAASPQSISDPR